MSETLEPALPPDLDRLAERWMRKLCERELKVATVESCTGGLLASLLTDIEGCGHGFDRSFVTYSKDAKAEQLGIDPDLLERNEAVSEPVARAMAEGALARSGADFAISVTGSQARPGTGMKRGWSTSRSHRSALERSTGLNISALVAAARSASNRCE